MSDCKQRNGGSPQKPAYAVPSFSSEAPKGTERCWSHSPVHFPELSVLKPASFLVICLGESRQRMERPNTMVLGVNSALEPCALPPCPGLCSAVASTPWALQKGKVSKRRKSERSTKNVSPRCHVQEKRHPYLLRGESVREGKAVGGQRHDPHSVSSPGEPPSPASTLV